MTNELDQLSDLEFLSYVVRICNERPNVNLFGVAVLIKEKQFHIVSDVMPPEGTNYAQVFRDVAEWIEKYHPEIKRKPVMDVS
jgi:hypothetical protein